MKTSFWFISGGVLVLCALGLLFLAPRPAEGERLYRKFGCGVCHGEKGEGSGRGPSLRSLSAHWQTETLAVYLRDPAAARTTNERLHKLAQGYLPLAMPTFEDLRPEQSRALADYLLQD